MGPTNYHNAKNALILVHYMKYPLLEVCLFAFTDMVLHAYIFPCWESLPGVHPNFPAVQLMHWQTLPHSCTHLILEKNSALTVAEALWKALSSALSSWALLSWEIIILQTHPPFQLGSDEYEEQLKSEVVGFSLPFAPHFLDVTMSDTGSCLAFPSIHSCALGTYPDITTLSANYAVSTWPLLPGLDVDK